MADSESTTGRSPAFQFYPNDFLSDRNVVVMSMQERGVYITLICHAWQSPLPVDVAQLARICGVPFPAFRKLWPAVGACFVEQDGHFVHPRLERERQKQAEYRRRQSDRGRASGVSRRHKHEQDTNAGSFPVEPATNAGSIPVRAPVELSVLSQSLSLSQSSDCGQTHTHRAGAFCEWYAETHERLVGVGYIGNPRRDYESALALCERLTDTELREAAIVWFGQDDKWAKEGTRTIPKFASRASDLVLKARRVSA